MGHNSQWLVDGQFGILQHERLKSNNSIITSEEILFKWKNGKGGILFLYEMEMAFNTVFFIYAFIFFKET